MADVRGRLDLQDDAGTTLLEMVVTMAILTVFMGVFTTSVMLMTKASSQVQAISEAVDQGNTAFLTLERTARYSTGISKPAVSAGASKAWHVELGSRPQDSVNGTSTDVCTQLRVFNKQLQSRTWTVSGTTYQSGTLTAWKPLASNVTNGSAAEGSSDQPFVVPAASAAAASPFQRLRLLVVTTGGAAGNPTTHRTSTTITALNSTSDIAPSTVCNQVSVEATP